MSSFAQSRPDFNNSYSFIENKGQWQNNVSFGTSIQNGYAYFSTNSIYYTLTDGAKFLCHDCEVLNKVINSHHYSIQFINSNTVIPTGEYLQKTKWNFLKGNNPTTWGENAKSYSIVNYHNIYKSIDLKYKELNGNLKYEYVVHPKGDISNIKMKYQGVDNISLINNQLKIKASLFEVTENAPIVYQIINGKRISIAASYQLNNQVVSFNIGRYNVNYDLIIDPEIIFSTYSPSKNYMFSYSTCSDNLENGIATGVFFNEDIYGASYEFPTTLGASQTTFTGDQVDIVVWKLSADGSTMLSSTYVGGDGLEFPISCLVDKASNDLLIEVSTNSSNLPTHDNAYSKQLTVGTANYNVTEYFESNIASDAYIIRLDENGGFDKGTYYGGSENDLYTSSHKVKNNDMDELRGDIAFKSNGDIVIVGSTNSSDLVTKNAFQTDNAGTSDAFVVEFSSDLSTLINASYLGGFSEESVVGLVIDDADNIYISGTSGSYYFYNNYAYDGFETFSSKGTDAYVAKINSQFQLTHYTFIGSDDDDFGYYIDNTPEGNIILFGQTKTLKFGHYPSTKTIYGTEYANQFLAEFDENLTTLNWSTTFGPIDYFQENSTKNNICPVAFQVNACGHILFTGYQGRYNNDPGYGTISTKLPITADAFYTNRGGPTYTVILEKDADSLIYASYFTDSGTDHCHGKSRYSSTGHLFHAPCVRCYNSNKGQLPLIASASGDFPQSDQVGQCNQGFYSLNLTNYTNKTYSDTTCKDESLTIKIDTSDMDSTYLWEPHINLSAYNETEVVFQGETSVTYTVSAIDSSNCPHENTYQIIIPDNELSVDYQLSENCTGDLPELVIINNSTNTTNYHWYLDGELISHDSIPSIKFEEFGEHLIKVIAQNSSCQNEEEIEVSFQKVFVPNIVTPNGDGKNETFVIKKSDETSDDWVVNIYNRWGQQVYSNAHYKNDWIPNDTKDGTYYYLITSPTGTICKGWLQLVR